MGIFATIFTFIPILFKKKKGLDMKKMLLAMSVVMGTLYATADTYTYPYLAFQRGDGTVVSIGVESLGMTISDGYLYAVNDQASKSFVVADLTRMYFSAEDTGTGVPTSIDVLNTEDSGPAQVYTPSGVHVGTYSTLEAAKAAAKGGVYIIRQNGKTLKVIAR